MTPDEKKQTVENLLKEKMPSPFREVLIKEMRPSIRLCPTQETTSTFLGGQPMLEGVPWPRFDGFSSQKNAKRWTPFINTPLPFIAQINLAEIKPFDLNNLLPESGVLIFFYLNTMADFHLYPEYGEIFKVESHKAPAESPKPFPEELAQNNRYTRVHLIPKIEWTLPPVYALTQCGLSEEHIESNLQLWDEIHDTVSSVQGFPTYHASKHRISGYPDLIQWPDFDLRSELVLQIDSDSVWKESTAPRTGMMWGDAGRLYFQIKRSDLEQSHWHNIWMRMETS